MIYMPINARNAGINIAIAPALALSLSVSPSHSTLVRCAALSLSSLSPSHTVVCTTIFYGKLAWHVI